MGGSKKRNRDEISRPRKKFGLANTIQADMAFPSNTNRNADLDGIREVLKLFNKNEEER